MTMNMPPPYNQSSYYLNNPSQSFPSNRLPTQSNLRQNNETIRPQRNINISQNNVNRSYSPLNARTVSPNQFNVPTNTSQPNINTGSVRYMNQNVSR